MLNKLLLISSLLLTVSACASSQTDFGRGSTAVVASGQQTSPPMGLILYCRSNPADCDTSTPSNSARTGLLDGQGLIAASQEDFGAPDTVDPYGLLQAQIDQVTSASLGQAFDQAHTKSTHCGSSAFVSLSAPACLSAEFVLPPSRSLSALVHVELSGVIPRPFRFVSDDQNGTIAVPSALDLALADAAMGSGQSADIGTVQLRSPRSKISLPLASIAAVNAHVNAAIAPASDLEIYGVGERWAMPIRTMGLQARGNCKDYALEKRAGLLALGAAPDSMALALVDAPGFGRHVVLVVATEGGDLIMDNLVSDLRAADHTDYHWLAIQNGPGVLSWTTAQVVHGPRAKPVSDQDIYEAAIIAKG
jgi:predicted transglutaminase-like cysteine proteinase